MKKKVAVILNGCGHRDGSEIHEAVLTFLGIERAGAVWDALAPDLEQARVLNHLTGQPDESSRPRNMLMESARIARGRIKNLAYGDPSAYDAVIIPGGSGTASNLCNYASKSNEMTVIPDLVRFLEGAHKLGRPIGAICISPVILARVFGGSGVRITLGDADCDAAKSARSMGAVVDPCAVDSCVVDTNMRIVTTPAYMLDAGVIDIEKGIAALAREVIAMI